MSAVIGEFKYRQGRVVFYDDRVSVEGSEIAYADMTSLINHRDVGWFQFSVFRTDSSVLETGFRIGDDEWVILERKGRSLWGIGTNGVVKRQWRATTEILQQYAAPYVAQRFKAVIDAQGYLDVGNILRIDPAGITKIASKTGERLEATDFGSATINRNGKLVIRDAEGRKFTTWVLCEENTSTEGVVVIPALLDLLYRQTGRATAARAPEIVME